MKLHPITGQGLIQQEEPQGHRSQIARSLVHMDSPSNTHKHMGMQTQCKSGSGRGKDIETYICVHKYSSVCTWLQCLLGLS